MLKICVVFAVFVCAVVVLLLRELWRVCARLDECGYEDSTSEYGGLGE